MVRCYNGPVEKCVRHFLTLWCLHWTLCCNFFRYCLLNLRCDICNSVTGNQTDSALSDNWGLTLNAQQGTFSVSAQFKAERQERHVLLAQVQVFADSNVETLDQPASSEEWIVCRESHCWVAFRWLIRWRCPESLEALEAAFPHWRWQFTSWSLVERWLSSDA